MRLNPDVKTTPYAKPDLLITGGRVLNVYSGEILPHDVVIQGQSVCYVGPSQDQFSGARKVIRADGCYVIPGFFDPHAHTDILFNPASFSNQVILTGTTSVFSDSHDLANALGFSGFKTILKDSEKYPIKFFSAAPAASPPFPSIEGKDVYTTAQFEDLIMSPSVLGVSEITAWARIIDRDPDLLDRVQLARKRGKRVEGHTLGASYLKLNRLVDAGITACHEALDWKEAITRLRLGLFVMLRHGSIRSDLKALLALFKESPRLSQNRVMLTPDTRFADDIMASGYMDFVVREAVANGIDPISAIRMVTLNPAGYFGLDQVLGGIAPGRLADILLVRDLASPTPHAVIERGRLTVKDGVLMIPPAPPPTVGLGDRPFQISSASKAWMDVTTSARGTTRVPAIQIIHKTVTNRRDITLFVKDGLIQPKATEDLLKICLIQRDGERIGKGFLSGFGLKGAAASSVSHDVHDLMVIGDDSEDMRIAADEVLRMGGGIVLAKNRQIVQTLPLPIGGIMSDLSMADLSREIDVLKRTFTDMGCRLEDPLLTMGFLSFTSILDLRITVSGVYSVKQGKIIFQPIGLPGGGRS
jgi:adenine deaminase